VARTGTQMPEPEHRTHSGTASLTPPQVFLRTRTWRSTYEGKNQIHTHHHTDVSTYPPAYFPHESITGSLYVVLYGMKCVLSLAELSQLISKIP